MIRKFKRAIGIRFSMKAVVRNPNIYLIPTQAKRNLSSRSGIGGVLSAT